MPLLGRLVPLTGLILAAILTVFALSLLNASRHWEYYRDVPLLNYVGLLISEHGFTPYRDVFETSMPGTLAFHSLIAGAGLTAAPLFMIVSCVIILSFSALGALAILPLGRLAAALAFPMVLSAMLIAGPGWILKIDKVALLPISAALCLAVWRWPGAVLPRQFAIGLLFGVAGTMKPHLMLGAPIVVLAAFALEYGPGRWRPPPLKALAWHIAASLAGFAVPVLLVLIWLVSSGAYDRFVFVLTDYLPLHLEKTDWQEFLPPEEKRRIAIAATLRFGGNYPLVPVAALTPLLLWPAWPRLDARQVIIVMALCLLAALYGLAPALGGQFYIYYYFPFFFFCLLLTAASAPLLEKTRLPPLVGMIWILAVAAFLVLFASRFYYDGLFRANRLDQVARMEASLQRWLPEGGRVQPIDWTSGVVHAMLRQKVLPATPYLYDYHFHHHVSAPVNRDLRHAFIAALTEDPPEMFMQAKEFPRVFGLDTSDSFPARDRFLAERYRQVADEEGFVVYLRNDLIRPCGRFSPDRCELLDQSASPPPSH